METQKGPSQDYSPFKGGAIWVSMLVWGSVGFGGLQDRDVALNVAEKQRLEVDQRAWGSHIPNCNMIRYLAHFPLEPYNETSYTVA